MQLPEIARVIQQDLADLQTLNMKKTPEFFVNGSPLAKFSDEELVKLIQEELAAANNGKK